MRNTRTSIVLLWALVAGAAVLAMGCASEHRAVQSEQALLAQKAKEEKSQQEVFAAAVERLVEAVAARSAGKTEPATLNILAMSGGGDYGAFGAGFLVGWGESADASYHRPEFDAVSGVSTGALLAPYAFVGTDSSCEKVQGFYRNPKPDWVEERGLFFFMPNNPSLMTIPGLQRDIKTAVDDSVIKAMAAQSAKGRVLMISATNLDFGTQHLWDLGEESARSLKTGDPDRVRKILLASAAIPAVFPPVLIDDVAYADGGVTANVLLRLAPKAPNGFIQVWKRQHPELPMPKVRYWVIINNQLHQPPVTVQPQWPKVLSPALATSIRSATLAEVRWLVAEAEYTNVAFGTDIEVRVVAIPDEWRAPVHGDFQKKTMESLTDLGRKLGAEESSWQLWASVAKSKP